MAVANIKSTWVSGDLKFYQSTACNSNNIQFGNAADDMKLVFYGTNHSSSGATANAGGYIKININGQDLYLATYSGTTA